MATTAAQEGTLRADTGPGQQSQDRTPPIPPAGWGSMWTGGAGDQKDSAEAGVPRSHFYKAQREAPTGILRINRIDGTPSRISRWFQAVPGCGEPQVLGAHGGHQGDGGTCQGQGVLH